MVSFCKHLLYVLLASKGNALRSPFTIRKDVRHLFTTVPLRAARKVNEVEYERMQLRQLVESRSEKFDANYDPKNAYIARESLQYIPRPALHKQIVKIFLERQHLRNAYNNSHDKRDNPLAVLPGALEAGKSTELARFPASQEYQEYAAQLSPGQRPVVSLVSFTAEMEGPPTAHSLWSAPTFGLRLIFGALKCAGAFPGSWSDFYCSFPALLDMDGRQGLELLRSVLGKRRRIYIGVELNKSKGDHAVMRELGWILDCDGDTDVAVSTVTPNYVEHMLSGGQKYLSNRPIRYAIIPPLWEMVQEYPPLAEKLIEEARSSGPVDERNVRMLHAATKLAGGHPATIQQLVSSISENVTLRANIIEGLHNNNPYEFLTLLTTLYPFHLHSKPPSTPAGREAILSMQRWYSWSPPFNTMLEKSECFMHVGRGSDVFVATTSLSTFFVMLSDLQDTKTGKFPPLSAAAAILFRNVSELPELWKRCCALSILARSNKLVSDWPSDVDAVFNVRKMGYFARINESLELHFAQPNDTLACWRANTLVVGSPSHTSWDLLLRAHDVAVTDTGKVTLTDTVCSVYVDIHTGVPSSQMVEVVAQKITRILADHVSRMDTPYSTSTDTAGTSHGYTTTEERFIQEELGRTAIVFLMYPLPGADTQHETNASALQEDVHTHLLLRASALSLKRSRTPQENVLLASLYRAIWYVKSYYQRNVRIMDNEAIEKSTIPALLPIADLVQITWGPVE